MIVFICSASLLLIASLYLAIMLKKLRLKNFHGYHTKINEKNKKTGIFYGLKILTKNRYVLGIFLLVFLGDILSEILNYKRISIVMNSQSESTSFCASISNLYLQIVYMQAIGFFISIFLTNGLMRFLGTRYCLFIMPCITLIFSLIYIVSRNDQLIIWLYILSKAMYYTLGAPIRESLYIVTTKDIQFKAKFVIDALGTKLGRNTGQSLNYGLNIIGKNMGQTTSILAVNFLFISIPLLWIIVAFYVFNLYRETVDNDQVIS
jgi:ATP/ADP translocase